MTRFWEIKMMIAVGLVMLAGMACTRSLAPDAGPTADPSILVSPAPIIDSQTRGIMDKLLELSARVNELERKAKDSSNLQSGAGSDLESRVRNLERSVSSMERQVGSGFGLGSMESRVSSLERSVSFMKDQVGGGLGSGLFGSLESRVSALERAVRR